MVFSAIIVLHRRINLPEVDNFGDIIIVKFLGSKFCDSARSWRDEACLSWLVLVRLAWIFQLGLIIIRRCGHHALWRLFRLPSRVPGPTGWYRLMNKALADQALVWPIAELISEIVVIRLEAKTRLMIQLRERNVCRLGAAAWGSSLLVRAGLGPQGLISFLH